MGIFVELVAACDGKVLGEKTKTAESGGGIRHGAEALLYSVGNQCQVLRR